MSVRSVTLASAIALLGLAGHSLADGSVPGLATIGFVFAFSVALSVPAVSKRRSVLWVFLYLLGAQALIHLIMSFTHKSHGSASPWSMVLFHVAAAAAASLVLVRLDDFIAHLSKWGRGILGVSLPLSVIPQGNVVVWGSESSALPQSAGGFLATRAPPVGL